MQLRRCQHRRRHNIFVPQLQLACERVGAPRPQLGLSLLQLRLVVQAPAI